MKRHIFSIRKRTICLPALLIMALFSCRKFVEIPSPIDQITSNEAFATDATAISAVNGLYGQMMASNLFFMNGALSLYGALSADELYNTTTSTTISPFYQNALQSNNSIISTNLWRYAYNYIYQANACIENIASSPTLSTPVKEQLTGELLFSRAICYFYLVNLFGDVPLETSTNYKVNQGMPRTTSSVVYDQIIDDLKHAESFLSVAYQTTEKIRPNKHAASALLAKVYLFRRDYVNAELQATKVISSGIYSLSSLANVFLANSTEAIWQLAPVTTGFNSAEGNIFIPSSATVRPSYVLSTYLLNAFESGDLRKTNWLRSNTVSGIQYYYPSKYKIKTSTTKTEYNMVLRLAETYLIRAEARAYQSNMTGALGDLNTIRNRAGLSSVTGTLTQAQLINAVMQENRVELFAEWGNRWLTLKRSGQADAVLGIEKTGWETTDALYPIPFQETQKNIYLTQNPGY